MTLDHLREKQFEEFQVSRRNWIPFIGNDLYLYMKHPWSNFTSLQACANEIRSSFSQIGASSKGADDDEHNSDSVSWNNIDSKFREGNYAQWANSWAGLFIMALRTMRERALTVASYLAKRKTKGGMHPSEISEDLGTVLYSDFRCNALLR